MAVFLAKVAFSVGQASLPHPELLTLAVQVHLDLGRLEILATDGKIKLITRLASTSVTNCVFFAYSLRLVAGYPRPATNNYPHKAPMTPVPSSPWPYTPSSPFAPSSTAFTSDFDPSHLVALRQQTTSTPPSQSYYAPQQSWARAFQFPNFTSPTFPYNSMTLTRPWSDVGMSRSATPFDHSPASTLSSFSDVSRYKFLPERPSEWRKDFTPKHGFEALMPRARSRSRSFAGASYPLCF